MRYLLLASVVAGCVIAGPASAWCDKDCEGLCRATAGKGMTYTADSCVQQYRCQQYAGKQCEPARMQSRAQQINAGSQTAGGSHQRCMDQGTKAGWGTAETARYCQGRR
jgi:hypothetical protein